MYISMNFTIFKKEKEMKSYQEQMESFKSYIQNERRLSRHTLTAYITDLVQFQDFLATTFHRKSYTDAGHNEIRMWIVELKENQISSRSINRKISTLKSFYKFMLVKGQVDNSPMNRIVAPKSSRKLPVYFEQNKLNQLFELKVFSNDFQGIRDIVVMELLSGTGMRLAELMEIKDTDVVGNQIKVIGKGAKERIVPIPESLVALLDKYREYRTEKFPVNDGNLLVTNKGDKLYEKFVYRLVNHYLGLVTNETKRSPHTMRHSFATNMLNNGAQLLTIKEILGHSNLAATQVYTHNSIERLKDAYKKYHPKEN